MSAALMAPGKARADDDLIAPTLGAYARAGYSVYKSELVQSNDTSFTTSYGVSVYAGKERNVGMRLAREQTSTAFELNGSSLSLSWQDVELRYRLGPVYLGVLASSSSAWLVAAPLDEDGDGVLDPTGEAHDFLNITSTGLGGSLGLALAINRRSHVYADLAYVMTQAIQEAPIEDAAGQLAVKQTLGLGPRMDVDAGVAFKITRSLLDVHAGFKHRRYQLDVDGQSYAELLNTTYVGLGLALYF